MKYQKIRILIPFLLTAILLIYCWITLLSYNYIPSWKHYTALSLFLLLIPFALKNLKFIVVPLGFFLFLASFHIISLSYNHSVIWFGSNSPYMPRLQLLSFGFFVLYAILNTDILIEMHLDRKENEQASEQLPERTHRNS